MTSHRIPVITTYTAPIDQRVQIPAYNHFGLFERQDAIELVTAAFLMRGENRAAGSYGKYHRKYHRVDRPFLHRADYNREKQQESGHFKHRLARP
jgi:hypothetical protein